MKRVAAMRAAVGPLAVGLAAVGLAGAAQAESVSMTGKFAAPERDVARLRSLGIDRFSGRDGPALSSALERRLSAPVRGGPPHFDIVAVSRRSDGGAEGIVTGSVSTGVQETPWTRTEKKCVEKDGLKCKREEEVKTPCMRRIVEFAADVRVVSADDRVLYSRELPRRDETTWCEGQSPSRTVEATVRGMVGGVADELAGSFAPSVETYSVRFREGTKGLDKEVARRFKVIVRQTQTDLKGACAAWAAMDAEAPNHPSILFDLGLCAEAVGDYAKADNYYARAAPLTGRGGEGEVGLTRIARLVAAREDDRARADRP